MNLRDRERRVYSEHGEDGVIETIFDTIGAGSRVAIEIGAGDGQENNTRLQAQRGWRTYGFDRVHEGPGITRAFVTPRNVMSLLANLPEPDLVSVDIDSLDWYVVRVMLAEGCSPRVWVVEYNATIEDDRVVAPDAEIWDGTDYFGAGLAAFVALFTLFGYTLVYCEASGANAFFVRADLAPRFVDAGDVTRLYRPAGYPPHPRAVGRRWLHAREMLAP